MTEPTLDAIRHFAQQLRELQERVDALEACEAARGLAIDMDQCDVEDENNDRLADALDQMFNVDHRQN
jgi:hypothetical protein